MEIRQTLRTVGTSPRPHSLGKLIEWKSTGLEEEGCFGVPSPHSLGKLIEWKFLPSIPQTGLYKASPLAGETN